LPINTPVENSGYFGFTFFIIGVTMLVHINKQKLKENSMHTATNSYKNSFLSAMSGLKDRYGEVLVKRLNHQTLKQISSSLDVTPARVCQIEREAWEQIEEVIAPRHTQNSILGYFLKGKISHRTYWMLAKNNIRTVEDLLRKNKRTIRNIKGIGEKTLSEIEPFFADYLAK
jgi:Bacterial RNA polymerase, alpha chain C terminal domain/Sigma-70, region 4